MLETEIKKLTAALEANTAAITSGKSINVSSEGQQGGVTVGTADLDPKPESVSTGMVKTPQSAPDAETATDGEDSQDSTDSAPGGADESTGETVTKEAVRDALQALQKATDVSTVKVLLEKHGGTTLSKVEKAGNLAAVLAEATEKLS